MTQSRRLFVQSLAVLGAGCTRPVVPNDGGRGDAGGADTRLDGGGLVDGGGDLDAAAPTGSGWGEGFDAGRIEGDLWTPGRDAAGVVNRVSVESLDTMRFYDVAGTALASLESVIVEAIPGWRDTGVSGWNGFTDSWVGMAYDVRPNLERAWIGPGGGHSGSSNNGVYRHDVRRLTWSVQDLPSPSSIFPAGYNGSTGYPPAEAAWRENPTGPIFYDEIYDPAYPGDPVRSSRKPTSRHTYGSLAFAPEIGDAGSLLMGCRRQWRFDLAVGRWDAPLNMMGVTNQADFSSAENMSGWWDEVRRRYYHCGNNASYDGSSRNYWWAPETGAWGGDGAFPASGWNTTTTSFEKLGRRLYMMRYGIYPNDRPGQPELMVQVNLDAETIEYHTILLGRSFDGLTFASSSASGDYWDTHGMTYLAPLDRWLLVVKTVERGEQWAWVDGSTWVCELAADVLGPATGILRLENKIKYFTEARILLWFRSGTQNVRVLRV